MSWIEDSQIVGVSPVGSFRPPGAELSNVQRRSQFGRREPRGNLPIGQWLWQRLAAQALAFRRFEMDHLPADQTANVGVEPP